MAYLLVYRNGTVVASEKVDMNALPAANAKIETLVDIMQTHCRLAKDNTTWLCPGVPEAKNHRDAYKAFIAFRDRCNSEILNKKIRNQEANDA